MHASGALSVFPAGDAVEDELRRFDADMDRVRGLAWNTRTQRVHIVRRLLSNTVPPDSGALPLVSIARLRQFLTAEHGRWSPGSAAVLASTLRAHLRFRAAGGDPIGHLLPVITAPAHWRLASLPETLSPTEVTRLLAAFFPDLPSAARAYAMVRCVVDLGLRAQEVVGLQLDDIDWRTGTIRIGPAKSRRLDSLPLPQATGSAIASYLQSERPPTTSRCVFVRHVAPVDKPIGPNVVRQAVRAAYRRCGLPYTRVRPSSIRKSMGLA